MNTREQKYTNNLDRRDKINKFANMTLM